MQEECNNAREEEPGKLEIVPSSSARQIGRPCKQMVAGSGRGMPLFAATGSPLACIRSFQWVPPAVQMRNMKPAGKTDLLSNFERAWV